MIWKKEKQTEEAQKKVKYQEIVWLNSFPKSGNTWLRCFLDAYFLGEININEILTSIPDDHAPIHEIAPGVPSSGLPVQIQHLTRPMAMLRTVIQYMQSGSRIPLFVKSHNSHMVINGIEMLPQSLTKASVYIVRDPRDVLPSFAKHMGKDIDYTIDAMCNKYHGLASTSKRMFDFIGRWDRHVTAALNADTHNFIIVRYEDMLRHPVDEFTRILMHAGVDVDRDKVIKAVELTELSKLRRQQDKSGFIEASKYNGEFFGKGGSACRDTLTPKQLHRIEKEFGPVMKKLEYIERKVA